MELLDAYTEPLRFFMAADFKATRKSMRLSQLKMAELLDIDLRSYADLEHGKRLCCTRVFIRYLIYCKEDREAFMRQLEQLVKDTEYALTK